MLHDRRFRSLIDSAGTERAASDGNGCPGAYAPLNASAAERINSQPALLNALMVLLNELDVSRHDKWLDKQHFT